MFQQGDTSVRVEGDEGAIINHIKSITIKIEAILYSYPAAA